MVRCRATDEQGDSVLHRRIAPSGAATATDSAEQSAPYHLSRRRARLAGPALVLAAATTVATLGLSGTAAAGLPSDAGVASRAEAAVPSAQPVATAPFTGATFEDGTTDGFTASWPARAIVTTAAARTGTHSLAVWGMTGYSQGAVLWLPAGQVVAGNYYYLQGYVRLPVPTLQDFVITMPGSAGAVVSQITRANGTGWAQVALLFRGQAGQAGLPTPLRIEPAARCADAPPVPVPFFLDDVSLMSFGTMPPPLPYRPPPSCPLHPATGSTP